MKKAFILILLFVAAVSYAQNIDPANWAYIEVDSSRAKWGDFDEPEWLRYFGLSFQDVNHDDLSDIVSGRYVYLNPGGEMTGPWQRIDFDLNADGMISMDVDGDDCADVIAQALPDVYWIEADDKTGLSWKAKVIAQVPRTGHVNGQGYCVADIFAGGKPEAIMSGEGGVFALRIPENLNTRPWEVIHVVHSNSNEGFDCADMDGDGDLDIVAGSADSSGDGENANILSWYENPNTISGNWEVHFIGNTVHAIDRVCIADLNGDGKHDVGVAEEQYPPQGPTAYLFWFEQKEDGWERHTVVEEWSLHNLDIADMDGDGDMDLITSEHQGPNPKTQIFENDGKGNFTECMIDQGKESHLGTQVCDLDNDGDLDIASIAWNNYKYLHVWRNDVKVLKKYNVQITSCHEYRTGPHFKVDTPNATFYIEKSSGGITSMIDQDGNDWVNYKKKYDGKFPESAAGDFRGIPNMVYGQELDSGTGHPGFNTIKSVEQVSGNKLCFVSENGYEFSYTFTDEYVKLDVDKVILDQKYWILYEGPIGGSYETKIAYWGTDLGMRSDTPDYLNGERVEGKWQWAYFGSKNQNRVLVIKQKESDNLADMLGFLGNDGNHLEASDGMVVFGLGRSLNTKPLFSEPNTFYFGFFENQVLSENEYHYLEEYVNNRLK